MKYIAFRQLITTPIFTPQNLKNLGAVYTNSQLTHWQQKGYLTKLRNGVYIFTDALEKLNPFSIAPHLVNPSYISLTSALSHYSLIPEAVFSISSVTTRGTRTYQLAQGHFTFQHLPPRLFFGYSNYLEGELAYNLAEPEKALLDFFYLTPSVRLNKDLESLRLNLEILDWHKLKIYNQEFDNNRLNHLISLLEKSHAHP